MSENQTTRTTGVQDGPYRRIAILVAGCIALIAMLFALNAVVRGFGGNERKLAEAFITSLQQPYINGTFGMSRQAQTNSFEVKGDFHLAKLKDLSANATIKAAQQGESLEIPAKLYAEFGKASTYYVNVSNIGDTATALGQSTPAINADIISIADKIEGKWLKVPQNKGSTTDCMADVMKKMSADDEASRQVASAYASNRFIVVETMEKKSKSSQEYTVSFDSSELNKFIEAIKKEDFFKSINTCSKDFKLPFTDDTAAEQPQQQTAQIPEDTTKILVEDGKITNIDSSTASEGRVDTTSASINYKKGTQLSPPKTDLVNIKSLKPEISSISKYLMQQQMSQMQQPTQQ